MEKLVVIIYIINFINKPDNNNFGQICYFNFKNSISSDYSKCLIPEDLLIQLCNKYSLLSIKHINFVCFAIDQRDNIFAKNLFKTLKIHHHWNEKELDIKFKFFKNIGK